MKIKKRLLSLALSGAMMLGLMPGMSLTALAEGDTSYTLVIPSTLNVTNSGWNATDGISATGSLESGKKLTVSAESANSFALVSGENSVAYTMKSAEADTEATTAWEFTELPGSAAFGIDVADYSSKPAGTYQDTVTFTAKVESAVAGPTLTLSEMAQGGDPLNNGRGSETYYSATFSEGQQVAVFYKNTSGQTVKVVSDSLTASDISNEGKSATINVTIDNADKSQPVTYIYPATMANDDGTVTTNPIKQDGTLASIDCCKGSGAWNGDVLPSVTLENPYAIWHLTLANDACEIAIMDGNTWGNIACIYHYGNNNDVDAKEFYIAVPTFSSKIVITTRDTANNAYYYDKVGVTIEAGKYYKSSPEMIKLGDDGIVP